MPVILPETLLAILLWILGVLTGLMLLLLAAGAWIQIRRDQLARLRVDCHRRWEEALVDFLYQGRREDTAFHRAAARERRFLTPFLVRVLGVISGTESEVVRDLYRELRLDRGLGRRLKSRAARIRGLAALEVGHFRMAEHEGTLQCLLGDPVPHVAHAAACSLAATQNLDHAEPVLRWMLAQEDFQRDRLLWILESFGPGLAVWMAQRMDEVPGRDPAFQELYLLLVGSLRIHEAQDRAWALLQGGVLDVRAAALKALGSLGDPRSYEVVLPFAEHEAWVLRGQAAKVLGLLGGVRAVPALARLMGDAVYDVRRNAAYALSQLGVAGIRELKRLAGCEACDPFARDLAEERLQWVQQRGRA